MRRITLQEAELVEATAGDGLIEAHDEVVALEVHGGEVLLVVPPGAGAASLTGGARVVRGVLNLENERVLTFEIRVDATGAHFADRAIESAPTVRRPAGRGAGAGRTATAGEIMTREVLTIRSTATVKELAQRLNYHRISGMPVVDEQGIVLGVVSEADLISKRGATVADIMTTPVLSVAEDTPALEVAALLTEERIKRVPVLRDGKLVGLIGRSNVVSWVGSQGQTGE
jgi:CBS domain-containing protein